jgi:acetylornithine aminotransferase
VAFGPAAELLTPGSHGSTFGGNPVSCAAGLAVLRTIAGDGLLDHVKRVGERLRDGLSGLSKIVDVRGAGLLLGVVLDGPIAVDLADRLRARGFLTGAVRPDVLRLAPPLILSAEQADAFVAAVAAALGEGGEEE